MNKHPDKRTEEIRHKLRTHQGKLSAGEDKLMRAVFDVPDERISHDDCQAEMPAFVDALVLGSPLSERLETVRHHVDTCASCGELFEELYRMTLAEQNGEIPIPAHIPAPDLSFLPVSIPDVIRQWAAAILEVVAPAELPSFEQVARTMLAGLQPQKGRLVAKSIPVFGTGFGKRGRAELIVAETYVAVQRLIEHLSPAQIDRLNEQGKLRARIQEHALKAALSLDLDPDAAQAFAREFSKNVGDDPARLKELIRRVIES